MFIAYLVMGIIVVGIVYGVTHAINKEAARELSPFAPVLLMVWPVVFAALAIAAVAYVSNRITVKFFVK